MLEIVSVALIVFVSAQMIFTPEKFFAKKIAKLEEKNGGPLPQEEIDKRYKNGKYVGIFGIVFSTVMLFMTVFMGI